MTAFEFQNVPRPQVSSSYGYEGFGHFIAYGAYPTDRPFFWRDAHFVWPDGSLADAATYDSAGWLGRDLPDFSAETPREALSYSVGKLLSGLGWWVRHTYIDSKEPLAVTFVVDDADNGPFIDDILLRHMLFARLRGLSVDKLGIEYASRPDLGRRDLTPAEGMAQAAASCG